MTVVDKKLECEERRRVLREGVEALESSGAVVAGLASYVSVKWLTRYFETRTLIPFAIYSLLVGTICIIRFA
jgi:undecaprenyl-diphosphatase